MYERAVMGTILMAKVIESAGPLSMYSATMFCCTNQTKVAERLLLGELASSCCNGSDVVAQEAMSVFTAKPAQGYP